MPRVFFFLIQVEGVKRGRGSPKITQVDIMKKCMINRQREVTMSMISDMIEWMKTIQAAELYQLKRFDQTYQKKKKTIEKVP